LRVAIILGFIFSGLRLFAQQLLPVQHDTNTYNHEFIVNGVFDYASSSLQNDLTQKLFLGGYISSDIKDNSLDLHKGINRFGLDASAEAEYRNFKTDHFGKGKYGFLIKGGDYNYLSIIYPKDLFGLAFYGNEAYLGANADLSGTRFFGMSFQKLGFGLINKVTKSNISLNFYTISNYSEASIRKGSLFQNDFGDSISLGLAGTFDYSNTSQFIKGYGAGIDFDIRFPVTFKKDKISYFQFLAKNVGMARISENIVRYSIDTTLIYEGLTFDQIYGDQSIVNDKFSLLDSIGLDSTTIFKYRFMPGFLQVGKMIDDLDTSKFQAFYGLRMYPSVAYAPMIYAGIQWKATQIVNIGGNVSYGGYTNLRFGMYAQMKFSEFSLGVGTEDIVGLTSKKAGRGGSAVLRLRYKI
jgi:hypothetical protein